MTTPRKTDGRHLIQVSVKPDLYQHIRQHCAQLDIPMAIWARELIKREIGPPPGPPTP